MKKICLLIILSLFSACASAPPPDPREQFTLGVVQKEIRRGMSQADVAQALGSPNIVTRDSSGLETWIYDKIATEASYRNNSGGAGFLGGVGGMAGSVLLLGIPSAYYQENAGTQTTSQKTLTVVIRFNERSAVDSSSYHSSRF